MDKTIIIAKIKRQQAELAEMIAQIKKDRRMSTMLKILNRRYRETGHLLEALGDKSYIPKGIEDLDAAGELKNMEKKIERIRMGVKRIEKLEKQKEKIEKKLH